MSSNRGTNPMLNRASALSIRGRLLVGFALMIIIFLVAISINLFVFSSYTTQVLEISLPSYDKVLDLGSQINQTQSSIQGWLLTHNPEFKNKLDLTWRNINRIQSDVDKLSSKWNDRELLKNWDDVKALLVQLREYQINAENMTFNINNAIEVRSNLVKLDAVINQLLTIMDGPINATGERVGGMYDILYAKLQASSDEIIYYIDFAKNSQYVLAILAVLASIIISFITARSIVNHINIFRQYSSRIASGDLTQYLDIERNDEIGLLGKDLNTMTESLSVITKQIIDAYHNMVTTLDEVKQAVDVQSSGAAEQASSINEITSSLEEIEKSSAQTKEKAQVLGEVAERTREKGQLGLDAVEQSIQGMKVVRDKVQTIAQTILDLSNKTQQVGEITMVVNNLAQQSKMLALNATIEASKAGEAGRGFAAVAAEVKNLAEQSEQSTSQVQKILEDIRRTTERAVMVTEEGTKGVDHGTGLVEQTGEIIRSLSEVIQEATIASQQIQAAIRQESVGIEQITIGMNEINQVTSSFVSSSNQTTEAIDNLSGIVKSLKEQVDTYKI